MLVARKNGASQHVIKPVLCRQLRTSDAFQVLLKQKIVLRWTGVPERKQASRMRDLTRESLVMSVRNKACGVLSLAFLLAVGLALAQETPPGEYRVKAAFLWNFAKFIQWPTNAFTNSAAP